MAIKDIIGTAVDVGKSAVTRGRGVAERRLRGASDPSGSPSTVGAARPGEAGGPKSATSSTRPKKAKPTKAKPKAKKRAAATRAAANSGTEVSEAAKNA